ncbi:undecaprenyl-phosphate glucose phosphotransferase [Pararhodobacter zhoushanensis]|uniref:undecaprenyl-phosphate glucose phosphotransferase n=1 Tax=Pararhodobacter zhoushanensis TaxID=2479545 RepID=UPI000F8DEFFF|nr:undecaprenyl-phosphate glucose phosphotransferase [Pararhodobacter zhoushanensis]
MPESLARKRLFSENHRRRPWTGGARSRLLGGQAMAAAQRLSRPSIRPAVLGYAQFALDLLSVAVAGMISHRLVGEVILEGTDRAGAIWMGALCVVLAARLSGGYGFRLMRSLWRSVVVGGVSLIIGMGAVCLLLLSVDLVNRVAFGWVGLWVLIAAVAMLASRIALSVRIAVLVQTGRLEHRIVLVGGGEDLEPLLREIVSEHGKGRRMCGFFDERGGPRSPSMVAGYHKAGDIDDLVEFARLAKIDTVIIAIRGASQERIRELLARLFVLPVDIRVTEGTEIPEFSRKRRSHIGPFRLIEIYKRPIDGFAAFRKRVFDVVFASILLVAFSPLLLLVALAVRLESPGPALFRQKRHGYNNKPIEVLKFRSMYVDQCDPTAVKAVRRGDARVTRVGRFIRRTSIDELPQFINVIKGDLSLVGPRPHALTARTGDIVYDQITEAYSARHKVKPGVTGWAQINGWRGEMNSPEKIRARIEHDLYYIEHWSLRLDFKIALLTPWSLVTTKNAY